MHEFTLIQNIFSTILEVARANNLRSISKVTLQIGRLRQVMPDFLQFAFNTIAQDTIAAGAQLEIEHVPLTILCHTCNKKFTIDGELEHICICPECGGYGSNTNLSTQIEILNGKEIIIASIEGER